MPRSVHASRHTLCASGDLRIAYQVIGEGPLDLVFVPGFISNIDLAWDDPLLAGFLRRLAGSSRLIMFDKRGTGLSDRIGDSPSLEVRMDDLRAVMDAAGSQRAALFGISEGGAMAMLFAATYPERTQALALFGTYARYATWVVPPDKLEAALPESIRCGAQARWSACSRRAGPTIRSSRHGGRGSSAGASPSAAMHLTRMNSEIDIRPILSSIRVPTLILHSRATHESIRKLRAISLSTSPVRSTSRCQARTTCRGAATSTVSPMKSRSS